MRAIISAIIRCFSLYFQEILHHFISPFLHAPLIFLPAVTSFSRDAFIDARRAPMRVSTLPLSARRRDYARAVRRDLLSP